MILTFFLHYLILMILGKYTFQNEEGEKIILIYDHKSRAFLFDGSYYPKYFI